MKIKLGNVRRLTYGMAAFALTAVLGASMVVPGLLQQADAAQVTTRSIKMSTSQASATGASYTLAFTPAANAAEIIVDFCSNTPIPGDSCTATGGTNVPNTASVTGTNATAVSDGSTSHTIKITGASLTASVPYSIALGGIANPSATGTFYARIFTYATSGSAAYTPVASGTPTEGTYVDYGGVALSTAATVTITARVMETLTFCVSAAALSPDCTTATPPAIVLGHGSPTATLSPDQVDTASAYTQLSTNAQSGATVRMKASNTCTNGGLSSNGGSTCDIPGVGGSAAAIVAGNAAFGMCVAPGANTTATAPYVDGVNSCPTTWGASNEYGMDGNGTTGTTSTYGSQIFTVASAVNGENNRCTFAGTASLTTPAGIYTANESLIATGTF